MSGVGKVVCVTGASGYIASWLVKLLLQRGYTVKATVTNLSDPNKVAHLNELEGAEERLHLFEANLMGDGSFDPVVHGCEGVFHIASPAFLEATDPQVELIEPAVKGTLNVLKSCSKVPSVRRVVLTSSLAAVMFNRSLKDRNVIIDEKWFSDPVICEEIKAWYCLAKTLAEEAAWVFSKQNGIDLVVMNPGYVVGPILQPILNYTSKTFLNVIKENKAFPWPFYQLVDVRDVAQAHVVAFENPSASGRYILIERTLNHSETLEILQKLYPSLDLPKISTAEDPTFQVCNMKAQDLGIVFTPSEVSLKDMVESLKEKKFLT